MAIPASDAFSLAHDPRRRTARSPSPKIFASSRAQHMPQPRRVSSNNASITRLKDVPEEAMSRGRSPDKKEKEKVDWEIPRKTLHSSIGFLTLHLYTTSGSPRTVVFVLAAALAALVPLDIMRLRWPAFERLYERAVGFLMRDTEKKSTNGVIWYLIGVIFVLTVYPLDIAVVSILILSWADTAASTIGRLYGKHTPRLPTYTIRLPFSRRSFPIFAARKSVAGFLAASLTGFLAATYFWGRVAPARPAECSWTWEGGVLPGHAPSQWVVGAKEWVEGLAMGMGEMRWEASGWGGLSVIGVVAGAVSGIAEALDIGSLDDNLTLPIISGGCIWGLFKVLEWVAA
ncbi:hypothetical protein NEOLEDRAFT_1180474 [Neolentinus lepideus HHB14362 ss-1]|uniref:Phosphatidate cytidylyltransferase n=1 Tax=Neolentinus lepideus HHB14362 ss-1 TaxID=1314782 RepID=A0A165QUG9_9AGAM|nr:hypothetical protein NEOLEDRAFT_1180474 [Neolentinus lepideus HHB14362 ss-1]